MRLAFGPFGIQAPSPMYRLVFFTFLYVHYVLLRFPVSRAQLTGGPSLPESATAHARPTYLSRWSEFTGVHLVRIGCAQITIQGGITYP